MTGRTFSQNARKRGKSHHQSVIDGSVVPCWKTPLSHWRQNSLDKNEGSANNSLNTSPSLFKTSIIFFLCPFPSSAQRRHMSSIYCCLETLLSPSVSEHVIHHCLRRYYIYCCRVTFHSLLSENTSISTALEYVIRCCLWICHPMPL